MQVSSPVPAYACPLPLLIQILTYPNFFFYGSPYNWIDSNSKITSLRASTLAKSERAHSAWVLKDNMDFPKNDMEDTFQLMWFRLEYKKIHYLVFYEASIEIPNTVRSRSFKIIFLMMGLIKSSWWLACKEYWQIYNCTVDIRRT